MFDRLYSDVIAIKRWSPNIKKEDVIKKYHLRRKSNEDLLKYIKAFFESYDTKINKNLFLKENILYKQDLKTQRFKSNKLTSEERIELLNRCEKVYNHQVLTSRIERMGTQNWPTVKAADIDFKKKDKVGAGCTGDNESYKKIIGKTYGTINLKQI